MTTPAPANMVVRPERPDDCAAAAAVHVAAWRAGYAGLLPDDYLAGLDPAQWTERRRWFLDTSTGRRSLVAELRAGQEEGAGRPGADDRHVGVEIAGFVGFGPYRDQQDHDRLERAVGEVYAIYVRPDRWGTGIAGALLHAALAGLPQPEVRLWVLAGNARARRFYQRHGFQPDGVTDVFRPRGRADVAVEELRYTLRR